MKLSPRLISGPFQIKLTRAPAETSTVRAETRTGGDPLGAAVTQHAAHGATIVFVSALAALTSDAVSVQHLK